MTCRHSERSQLPEFTSFRMPLLHYSTEDVLLISMEFSLWTSTLKVDRRV